MQRVDHLEQVLSIVQSQQGGRASAQGLGDAGMQRVLLGGRALRRQRDVERGHDGQQRVMRLLKCGQIQHHAGVGGLRLKQRHEQRGLADARGAGEGQKIRLAQVTQRALKLARSPHAGARRWCRMVSHRAQAPGTGKRVWDAGSYLCSNSTVCPFERGLVRVGDAMGALWQALAPCQGVPLRAPMSLYQRH